MRKLLLLVIGILLQGCLSIPEGYISQEEADKQKHAYFCSTYEPYSVVITELVPWEHIPHCINGSINQQQAFATLSWLMDMSNRLSGHSMFIDNYGSDENKALRNNHPPFFIKNYELVKRFRPYLYEGDYYYFLTKVALDGKRYYKDVTKDLSKQKHWEDIFNKAEKKLDNIGGGVDSYWSNPSYSDEKRNKLLIDAAKRGRSDAQYVLGNSYLKGLLGFEQNTKLGIDWIEQAARRSPDYLSLEELQQIKPHMSDKDYLYWKAMYLLSRPNNPEFSSGNYNDSLMKELLSSIKDWKYFCEKYRKQRWFWSDGGIISEKYEALQTIIVQCVTQYPPAEQPYINDLQAD